MSINNSLPNIVLTRDGVECDNNNYIKLKDAGWIEEVKPRKFKLYIYRTGAYMLKFEGNEISGMLNKEITEGGGFEIIELCEEFDKLNKKT